MTEYENISNNVTGIDQTVFQFHFEYKKRNFNICKILQKSIYRVNSCYNTGVEGNQCSVCKVKYCAECSTDTYNCSHCNKIYCSLCQLKNYCTNCGLLPEVNWIKYKKVRITEFFDCIITINK